jgi:hypothetical protein
MIKAPLNIFQMNVDSYLRFFSRTPTKNSIANIIKIITDSRFSGIAEGLVYGKFVGVGKEVGIDVGINDGENVVAGEGVEFVGWGVGEGLGICVGVGEAMGVAVGVAIGCSASRVNV